MLSGLLKQSWSGFELALGWRFFVVLAFMMHAHGGCVVFFSAVLPGGQSLKCG